MKRFTIFYEGRIYGEFDEPQATWLNGLPAKAYLYCRDATGREGDPKWLRKDLTPVLTADVPKEIRTMALILGMK